MEIVNLRIELSPAELGKALRLPDGRAAARLAGVVNPLLAPAVALRECQVQDTAAGRVTLEGVGFTSRVLAENLADGERVFAFVLTLGPALEERIDAAGDLLEKYCLEEAGNLALRKARRALEERLRGRCGRRLSCMSPGSLPDWPLEQQGPLFALLDQAADAVGVRLTESLLMLPRKSVSGIFFPSETPFFSCRLCPRERCQGRRAPFDPAMARDYGICADGRQHPHGGGHSS